MVLDFDRWLPGEVNRVPEWARRAVGRDAVEQEARLAVTKAACDWNPELYPGVPFGAFARIGVRLHLRGLWDRLAAKGCVWAAMPVFEDGGGPDPEDYRDPHGERLLHLWFDPDYAEQRRCLDMRRRLLLYLRTVEGLTLEETGECLGTSRERVRQLEWSAGRKLAEFRNRRVIRRQLAGVNTEDD